MPAWEQIVSKPYRRIDSASGTHQRVPHALRRLRKRLDHRVEASSDAGSSDFFRQHEYLPGRESQILASLRWRVEGKPPCVQAFEPGAGARLALIERASRGAADRDAGESCKREWRGSGVVSATSYRMVILVQSV